MTTTRDELRTRAQAALRDGLDVSMAAGTFLVILYQLDRAEARLKAVQDIHTGTIWPGVTDKPVCDACDRPWPCDTTRALEE